MRRLKPVVMAFAAPPSSVVPGGWTRGSANAPAAAGNLPAARGNAWEIRCSMMEACLAIGEKNPGGRESLAATVLLYSAGSFFPWWMCSLWGLGRGGVIKVMRPKCSFSKDVDDVIFKNARDLFRNPLVETCGRPALQKSPTLTERFILNDAPKCADLWWPWHLDMAQQMYSHGRAQQVSHQKKIQQSW